MGMRSAVFGDWLRKKMSSQDDYVVIHIVCGMDSRIERVGTHMIESEIRDTNWLLNLPKENTRLSFVCKHEMTPKIFFFMMRI